MTATLTTSKLEVDELVKILGATQSADFTDRRSDPRHPFFAPVSLRLTTSPQQSLSAFSREISYSGVGLLHNMEIERGVLAELTIKAGTINTTKTAEAVWVQPAGEGWYLSGWRFVTTA